eukprot:m.111966 g.111966  ORF g.111966 m.111966 type:complete len:181 (-) comp21392_c0_seq1:2865-3407(-)
MPKKVVKQKVSAKKQEGASLFSENKRTFGIGGDLPGKRDLGRFVKWPKYVRLQRQKAVLMKRLKVPPAIAQFANTLDKSSATELFRIMDKYRPETREAKKDRLTVEAEAIAGGGAATKGPKPVVIKYGINHITALIETKKAKLVIIAHDVEPIEVCALALSRCARLAALHCVLACLCWGS